MELEGRRPRTVLIAEDEGVVRSFAATVLRAAGYEVLEAASKDEALHLARTHPGAIDLLVTNTRLPAASDPPLMTSLRALRGGVQVLIVSGGCEGVAADRGFLAAGTHFLQKPFTQPALIAKVEEVLASEGGSGAG